MLAQASALGCGTGNAVNCLCTKPEFHFGIHDCAYQHCAPDNNAAASAVSWGNSVCASVTSGLTTTVSNLPATLDG
ncbi:hypothetical protein CONLIGDRAFT_633950 [Coniochaeta ligniaria NRRL 30616]|uniref:CFEM domain-containing protein n=1 Tax=Coniochaeta ligniaria NRRL 30616 TaxID=1408157 RepID=A0A1J7J2N9_9PEZI|nr:hypothetical protein CONLIGDRAFT_633950 [Coniochaeta ligniaria NRRL 30616]